MRNHDEGRIAPRMIWNDDILRIVLSELLGRTSIIKTRSQPETPSLLDNSIVLENPKPVDSEISFVRRDQAMGDPLLCRDPCDELNEALTYKLKPFPTDDLRMAHVPMETSRLSGAAF